jgi:4-amino-4-deoxy-L-arabinose transferase-like glycosyltransferase
LGFFTLLLIYGLARRFSGRRAGLMGSLFFLLMPMFTFLCGTAQVDFGLTFYITLSIILISYGIEKDELRYFILAGVFAGLSCGIKHQGILLIPLFPLIFFLRPWIIKNMGKTALAFCLPAIAVGCIWYVISFIWTGNPVYPLLYRYFKGLYLSPQFEMAFGNMMDSVGGKAFNLLHLIFLPFTLTFNIENWEYALSISPFFLAFLPALFGISRLGERSRLVRLFMLFSAGYFLFSLLLFNHHPRRLLVPILPVLSVSIAVGLEKQMNQKGIKKVVLFLIGLIALIQVPYEVYLLKHYLPCALGWEKREDFLKRTVENFSFVEKVNYCVASTDSLYVPFGEAYYFKARVITGYPLFSGGYTDYNAFSSPEELVRYLKKLGVQYVVYEEGAALVGDMATTRVPNPYVEHAYALLKGLKENFTEEVILEKRYRLLKLL